MKIHPVVNVSQIVWYKEQVKGQKKEEEKLIEVEEVKEWEVEKILNKRKIRGVEKYLMWWKRVHGRRRYMGKERESKECRRVDRRIRREDECGSKEVRKNKHGREKRL